MIYTHIAAAIVAAAIAATGAWQVQSWRYTGQIAEIRAEHGEALAQAAADARAKEQTMNANNQKVTNEYLAEKVRAAAAAGRALAAGRLLSKALADAATGDRHTTSDSGADDPRGTIASECAGALREVDSYAQQLASKARALQDYAGSVCVSK